MDSYFVMWQGYGWAHANSWTFMQMLGELLAGLALF